MESLLIGSNRGHEYIARDLNSLLEFKGEHLRDILKEVRKIVKVPHGQNIRTWLMENDEVIIVNPELRIRLENIVSRSQFVNGNR